MDRLIRRTATGGYCLVNGDYTEKDAYKRLADYEDTGLEPGEIVEFYRRFCAARDMALALGQEYADHADELLKAESEGRLIVLPYAPGTAFPQAGPDGYDVIFTGNVLYEVKCDDCTEYMSAEDILAEFAHPREEAEAALGGVSDD